MKELLSDDIVVVRDAAGQTSLQFDRVFKRAELDIGRVVASAFTVISAAAERVDVIRAIDIFTAHDAFGDVCGHSSTGV